MARTISVANDTRLAAWDLASPER